MRMSVMISTKFLTALALGGILWISAGCGANSPIPIDGESKTKAAVVHFVPNGGRATSGAVVSATATITAAQATAAALLKQPGTASSVTLGDEDGVASYDVLVVSADKKTYEVVVDATTGVVGRVEVKGAESASTSETETSSAKDADGASGPNDQQGENSSK